MPAGARALTTAVTIRDVGAKAGVSQATAARALGGNGHVSASVRDMGEAAARLALARLQWVDGRPRRIRLETKLIIRASCASIG